MAEKKNHYVDLDTMKEEELVVFIEEALTRLNAESLTAIIEMAGEKRTEKEGEAKEALLAEFRDRAASMGLSLSALFPASRKGRGTGSVAAKYKGPNGETWSGRGREPHWLAALEAEGKKREDYLIQKELNEAA